jgi:trk system potassium uptake protein TrkH
MDKDVLILNQGTSTATATRLLQRYEREDIVVTDDKMLPVGIVTDEDILAQVSDVTVYAETTILKQIMSSPLVTIEENSTLRNALEIMRKNHIRKLPVISKKQVVVGIVYQASIAAAIRKSTVIHPRFLSPPVKSILGNLGFVLQFSGVLLLVPAVLATFLNDTVIATGIYLSTVLLLVTGFFWNLSFNCTFTCYWIFFKLVWRKIKLKSTTSINSCICQPVYSNPIWNYTVSLCFSI